MARTHIVKMCLCSCWLSLLWLNATVPLSSVAYLMVRPDLAGDGDLACSLQVNQADRGIAHFQQANADFSLQFPFAISNFLVVIFLLEVYHQYIKRIGCFF